VNKQFDKSLRQLKTGREVLLALKTYGPLSPRSLRFVLDGASSSKVKLALMRLSKLGLIQQISYKHEKTNGAYYYLDSRFDKRILMAELLGCAADDLKLECLRHLELPHEQRCARVHHSLVKMFPEAKLYRDYQLDKMGVSEKVFPSLAAERRVYPDVLLHFVDNSRDYGECFIAFEIEEALKSKQRIMDKLHLYATESLLDGVVYISTHSQIMESTRHIFSNQTLLENLRIKHYGNNFLLFQNEPIEHDGLSETAYNLLSKPIGFRDWATLLMKTSNTERRNAQFRVGETMQVSE
jgi:hypothetical protein